GLAGNAPPTIRRDGFQPSGLPTHPTNQPNQPTNFVTPPLPPSMYLTYSAFAFASTHFMPGSCFSSLCFNTYCCAVSASPARAGEISVLSLLLPVACCCRGCRGHPSPPS